MYLFIRYDIGSPDRYADRPFTQYIGTVANSNPDDHGLGSAKTFRTSIQSVAAVYHKLKRNTSTYYDEKTNRALTCQARRQTLDWGCSCWRGGGGGGGRGNRLSHNGDLLENRLPYNGKLLIYA